MRVTTPMLSLSGSVDKLLKKFILKTAKEADKEAKKLPAPLEITVGVLLVALPEPSAVSDVAGMNLVIDGIRKVRRFNHHESQ